jgi:hypothetical protein
MVRLVIPSVRQVADSAARAKREQTLRGHVRSWTSASGLHLSRAREVLTVSDQWSDFEGEDTWQRMCY